MKKYTITSAVAFHHLSIKEMTEDERTQCNCVNLELERIINNIDSYILANYSIEEIVDYIDKSLKKFVDAFNSNRSKGYRLWVDGVDIIDIDEYMDIDEYSTFYQPIINSILNSGFQLPENFKLIIFNICVFVKGVPMGIIDSTKIG